MKIMKNRSMAVVAVLIVGGIISASLLLAQEAAAPVAEAAPVVEVYVEPEPVVAAPEEAVAAAPVVVVNVEAAPVVAAPVEAVATAPVDEAEVDDETDFVLSSGSTNDTGLITVSLEDVDLADVVSLFIRLSGANIICATTNLKGSVTANLQNVEWQPAFKAILERQNLSLVEDPRNKGIFIVEPRSPDEPEPWITETFKLSFVKASEAASMLESMLGSVAESAKKAAPKVAKPMSQEKDEIIVVKEDVEVVLRKGGHVVSYPSGNQIVVSTTEKKMLEIREVIKAIDLPRQQVYIEAKIIEISGTATKKIGLDWSMLEKMQIANMTGYRDYQYERTHAESDVIESSRLTTSESSGSAVDGATIIPTSASSFAEKSTRTYADKSTRGILDAKVWSSIFGLNDLQVFLSALQTADDYTEISNPKIIVANEEKAIIDMANKEPYVTVTSKTEGTGDNTTTTYTTEMKVIPGENIDIPYTEQAFFTYGIKLEVLPRINNASNITVTIAPTISQRLEYYWPTGDEGVGTRYPIIRSQHVKTIFSMDDGQTAVIGGLTQTRDRDIVKKIPLLGDIPLIGKYLFSHTSKAKSQVETVIFVTVGIIKPADPRSALVLPEAAELVQKRVNADGRLIKAIPAQDDAAQGWGVEAPNP